MRESSAWLRLREPGAADKTFLLMAADACIPVSFLRFTESAAGGTLEFTGYFREPVPEPIVIGDEPLLVHLTSARSAAGYIDEDCALWSIDGRLLFQSRQLRYSQIPPG